MSGLGPMQGQANHFESMFLPNLHFHRWLGGEGSEKIVTDPRQTKCPLLVTIRTP